MPGYVTAEQVAQALRPSLGSAVLEQTGLCEGAARLLKRFAPYRETLEELAQRVERTTRAQVQAAAQKLTLDTVYFLKGKE